MENLSATDILLLFVGMTVVVVTILAGGVLMASRVGSKLKSPLGDQQEQHHHTPS